MEQKIREYLIGIAGKGVIAPFDVEIILSDIMRIIKDDKCSCGKPYDYKEIDSS